MAVRVDESLDGIDWVQAKADLAADDFDNGRSPQALRASFERSAHVAIARDGDRVVGMARLLSDGVCNAYLLDVWTMSAYRRQGIGTAMVRQLMNGVPGQHIGLQTDDAEAFYASLGYRHQPVFMSAVVGEWLANEANPRLRVGCWEGRMGTMSVAAVLEGAQIRRVRSGTTRDVATVVGRPGSAAAASAIALRSAGADVAERGEAASKACRLQPGPATHIRRPLRVGDPAGLVSSGEIQEPNQEPTTTDTRTRQAIPSHDRRS